MHLNLFVPAGGRMTFTAPAGTNLYQCCIHPWMQTRVRVGSH